MLTLEFLAITADVMGKLMISYTAIRIHYRVWKEHKIDSKVFAEMRREQIIGIAGIVLIIVGYLLQLWLRLGYY